MSITNAVSDRYRTATDRIAATDWTRLAAAVVAVQLATALWYIYIELLALEGDNDILELGLGLMNPGDAVVVGLVIGTFLAPVLVATFLALSRILPIRRVYAQTAIPWLLFGPGLVLALIGYGLYDWGLELVRVTFEAAPWMYAEWAGMWILLIGILAAFAGGAFAITTGSVRPTERQRRGLIVTVAVLVAVPMVAGAAFPIDDSDDDSATDMNATASASEPTPNPDEYGIHNINYGEDGSADYLLVNNSTDPPAIHTAYNVSETHVGPEYFALQTISVYNGSEWTTVRGQYGITLERQRDGVLWNEQILTACATDATLPPGADYIPPRVSEQVNGDVTMAGIESMWVYYDVVNRDGDVERYIVELERSDA